VYGLAADATGVNYGVYSHTNSATGYAGFFSGGINFFEGNVGIGVLNPTDKLVIDGNCVINGFLGTNNTDTFELRANNVAVLRLDPTSGAPNITGGSTTNSVSEAVLGGTIGGGTGNSVTAGAHYGTIPGGQSNTVQSPDGFAAGRRARVLHANSFVWGGAPSVDTESTGAQQFIVRANGGVWLGDDSGTVGFTAGRFLETSTGGYLSTGGTWTDASDRALKENFNDVDCREILDRIASMPIAEWNYIKEGQDVRHIGPVAQDFRAAFGLGPDDKSISSVDANGVQFAAIKALNDQVKSKDAEIADLKTRIEALEALVNKLAESK